MPAAESAAAHRRRQIQLARRAVVAAAAAWSKVDPGDIGGSWIDVGLPVAVRAVTGAQQLAAAAAQGYVAAVVAEQGGRPDPAGELDAAAFAGLAADGRRLESLLYLPAITVKSLIAGGADPSAALRGGLAQLLTMAGSETTDAGRVAAGVAQTADRAVRGWTRHVTPPACGRCIILSGRIYRWSDGFQRHPRCDCVHLPLIHPDARSAPDPMVLFEAMTAEEQDRALTGAGARAVRDGADINQVVNARRGMYTAGGRSFTAEGTTRRGVAGRRLEQAGVPAGVRLMPEQIYREAGGDRDEAIRLLIRFGYIR